MFTRMLPWAALGLAATPFGDYAWHAWIAHGKRKDPTRDGHLEHHRKACDPVPVWQEMREHAGRVALTAAGLGLGLAAVVGSKRAVPIVGGLLLGYVGTMLGHAQMHERGPRGRCEEWMWRFHWHHHAADARVNFGLITPIFDFAFGTAVVPETVTVPARMAPAWLADGPGAPGFRVAGAA
jgi:sterol desaturase/sphingolipid hydroxylase (fatty acid hydroxylase superfamily)